MKENSLKLDGLNPLRFFAFLWVFSFHCLPKKADGMVASFFANFNAHGYLGVELFFVLSSFLLTYLGLHEKKATGEFSVKNFVVRRALRIMPLYYFIVLVSFILLPVLGRIISNPITIPANPWYFVFFLSNYQTTPMIYALGFLWSIAVEEQFYWTWAIALLIFRKNFTVVSLLMLTVYGFVFFILYPGFILHPLPSLVFLSNFAIGGVTALLFFHSTAIFKKLRFIILLLIILSLFLYLVSGINRFADHLLVALIFGALLLLFISSCGYAFIKQNFLYRVLDRLGIYTYGLYVYSGFVLTILHPLKSKGFFSDPFVFMLLNLTILIPVAMASYHFFEVKFLKYSKKFSWQPRTNRPIEVAE